MGTPKISTVKPTGVAKPTNPRFIDLEGRIFERLTVMAFAGQGASCSSWHCVCSCGTYVLKVQALALKDGRTLSCGCLHKERASEAGKRNGTHKGCHTPEYTAYRGAHQRCTNSKVKHYKNYGGRGIEFRFNSFEEWLKELGFRPTPKHSVDRKNNDGHYEIGNVKWSTRKEQARNRRAPFDT